MVACLLHHHTTRRGTAPGREYLDGLNSKDRARGVDALDDLEEFGTHFGMPHVRPLQGTPLWELRIRGHVQHRVFYVIGRERRIVLLHAFTKKTQRTAAREIRTALGRLEDYQRVNE